MPDGPLPPKGPWWVMPFAVVTYAALVVCAFGFISLLTDTDVIEARGTNPLVGPLMVLVATIVVGVAIVRESARTPPRVEVWSAIVTGAVATFAYALTGAVLELLAAADPVGALILLLTTMVRPFAVSVGAIAIVVVLAAAAVAAKASGHPPRPRWPWERGGAS